MRIDDALRTRLLERRELIRSRVRALEGDLDALVRSRRTSSDDDEHDPEGETLSAQWSMLSGLLASAREDAAQADEAMRRVEQGAYGDCAVCGGTIPAGQLEARPFRDRCVACAG